MAKRQIRNDIELDNLLSNAMYNAVDYTMQKIFEENSDLIDKYVYGAYEPELYQRSEQFRDAWNYLTKRSIRIGKGGAKKGPTGEFFYDPSVMDYDSNMGQHGTPDTYYGQTSAWWEQVQADWGDARDYLANIIYEGKSSHIFGDGPWTKKRDAWGQLVKKLSQGKIFSWFEEGMANQGLKVYKR